MVESSLSSQATKATAGRTAEVGTKLAVPPSSWEGWPLSHRWRHPLTPQIHFVVVVTFCLRWAMGLFVTLWPWLALSLWRPSYLNFPAYFFLLWSCTLHTQGMEFKSCCIRVQPHNRQSHRGCRGQTPSEFSQQTLYLRGFFFFLVPLSIWSSSLAYDTGTVAVIVCSALFRT